MTKKIRWGIMGTAKIATEKVIPAMMKSGKLKITAVASRDLTKAQKIAGQLGIPKALDSYESLLTQEDIDAVYIPLPNHLHVHWTAEAIKHGKHVLCEKPLALKPQQINELIRLRDTHKVKVGEAFMVKLHPQWKKVVELIEGEKLGHIHSYHSTFSYFNKDAENIRNIPAYGGGALWDIGCYPVMTSRWLFGDEPVSASCTLERDPDFGTDRLASALLHYPGGRQATFTVSTQSAAYQRVSLLGSKASLEIQIPFNAPADEPTKIFINENDLSETNLTEIVISNCDQYREQAEAFGKSIIDDTREPVTLEDAMQHSKIINALLQGAADQAVVQF